MNVLQEFLVSLGVQVDRKSFSLMQKTLKSAKAGVMGFATIAAAAAIATVKFVKSQLAVEDAVRKTAREMRISTKAARAHLTAVETLGKTWDEIRKDKDLMRQYRELRKLGEAMALPEAGEGVKQVQGLAEDFNKLRMTGKHALQWIFHYMSEYAAEPIKWIRGQLTKLREGIQKNMPKIGQKIGQVLGGVVRMLTTIVRAGKTVIDWFGKLDDRIKKLVTAFAAAGAIIAAGPFGLIMLAIGGVLLLLDDLFTYLDGGYSAIQWGPILDWAYDFKDELDDIGDGAVSLWEKFKNLGKSVQDFFASDNGKKTLQAALGALEIILYGLAATAETTLATVELIVTTLEGLFQWFSGDGEAAAETWRNGWTDWVSSMKKAIIPLADLMAKRIYGEDYDWATRAVAKGELIKQGVDSDEAALQIATMTPEEIRNVAKGRNKDGSINETEVQGPKRPHGKYWDEMTPEERSALPLNIKPSSSSTPKIDIPIIDVEKLTSSLTEGIENAKAHLDNGTMSSYTMPLGAGNTTNEGDTFIYSPQQDIDVNVTSSDPESAGRAAARSIGSAGSGMNRNWKSLFA